MRGKCRQTRRGHSHSCCSGHEGGVACSKDAGCSQRRSKSQGRYKPLPSYSNSPKHEGDNADGRLVI
jgi:hypothetical protein